jgi:hypothetical protein
VSWTAPAERSGDGAFERARRVEVSTRVERAKAVSRVACHRSPKRLVPRLPFVFDRRVFGSVLFGHRELGHEAGEQQNQISFRAYVTTKNNGWR